MKRTVHSNKETVKQSYKHSLFCRQLKIVFHRFHRNKPALLCASMKSIRYDHIIHTCHKQTHELSPHMSLLWVCAFSSIIYDGFLYSIQYIFCGLSAGMSCLRVWTDRSLGYSFYKIFCKSSHIWFGVCSLLCPQHECSGLADIEWNARTVLCCSARAVVVCAKCTMICVV